MTWTRKFTKAMKVEYTATGASGTHYRVWQQMKGGYWRITETPGAIKRLAIVSEQEAMRQAEEHEAGRKMPGRVA